MKEINASAPDMSISALKTQLMNYELTKEIPDKDNIKKLSLIKRSNIKLSIL